MARRIKPTSAFIKRYMNANNISQRDICEASGYSEKQVSLIMHDKLPVSRRFAEALESCIPGLQADFIMNYSNKYQEQLKNDETFLVENDYKTLSKKMKLAQAFKHITSDPVEQTKIVLESFCCPNLKDVMTLINNGQKNEIAVVYSKDHSKVNDRDNVVVTIWTRAVMNQITLIEDDKTFVGCKQTKDILNANKDLLSITNTSELIENIEYICNECGIHVAFSHAAPTSYIRGLSFSCNGQIYIVLTDRFKKIEYVVFAFVHEMMHIINGDINSNNDSIRIIFVGEEGDIDAEASNFLINQSSYDKVRNNPTINNLFTVARESRTSIGLVVAKYHYDTKDYQRYWQYLNDFVLGYDLFGNKKGDA